MNVTLFLYERIFEKMASSIKKIEVSSPDKIMSAFDDRRGLSLF